MSKVVGSKKPATSKLSRAKKTDSAKDRQPLKNDFLNESADDFVDVSTKPKKLEKPKVSVEKNTSEKSCSTESSTIVPTVSEILPKCRFCGKTFSIGQELKW